MEHQSICSVSRKESLIYFVFFDQHRCNDLNARMRVKLYEHSDELYTNRFSDKPHEKCCGTDSVKHSTRTTFK